MGRQARLHLVGVLGVWDEGARRARAATVICPVCSTEFTPKRRASNAKYCGTECSYRSMVEANRAVYNDVHAPDAADEEARIARCIAALKDGVAVHELRRRFGGRTLNEAQRQRAAREATHTHV